MAGFRRRTPKLCRKARRATALTAAVWVEGHARLCAVYGPPSALLPPAIYLYLRGFARPRRAYSAAFLLLTVFTSMRHLITGISLLLLPGMLPAAAIGAAAGRRGSAVAAANGHPAQGAYGFAGTIRNAKTQRPVVAEVLIYGASPDRLGKLQTDRTGTFTMTAETPGPYRFVVAAMGYVPQEVVLSSTAGTPAAFTVQLVPLGVGATVTLNSIRFAQGKAALLPESFAELNRLAALLLANPELEIQVNGHTDNQGDATQNQLLSEHRVRAVQEFLVGKGVAAGQLRGKGFGGAVPIASNDQEPTRRLNRRVEFEIVRD